MFGKLTEKFSTSAKNHNNKKTKKHLHFIEKYNKLKSANKRIKTLNKNCTLKMFETGQLGALARIKY